MLPVISRIKSEFKGVQVGCTPQEISQLMENQQVSCIPEVYRQLLLLTGQTLDSLFRGSSASAWRLTRGYKKEFIEEEISPVGLALPNDIFVFLTTQGVVWLFFRTKNCLDDPIVYLYEEDSQSFIKLANSITEYLAKILDGGYTQESQSPEYFLFDPKKDEFYQVNQI